LYAAGRQLGHRTNTCVGQPFNSPARRPRNLELVHGWGFLSGGSPGSDAFVTCYAGARLRAHWEFAHIERSEHRGGTS
jgi:hypothetical protein